MQPSLNVILVSRLCAAAAKNLFFADNIEQSFRRKNIPLKNSLFINTKTSAIFLCIYFK